MPSTVFDHPIFPGSKIIKKDITVTNTSGAYSATFTDNRISAGMQVNKMYIEDPSVFRSDISVQTLGGSFVFSCSDVVGTTDVTLEFLKIADDPNGITSTEFNVLNNRIDDINENLTPNYEVLENATMTIFRMGKMRVISFHGATGFYDPKTLPVGDSPSTHTTSSCYVSDASYNSIRIGRIYVENGAIYARQIGDYNTTNKGMARVADTDRVYGEIVYFVA